AECQRTPRAFEPRPRGAARAAVRRAGAGGARSVRPHRLGPSQLVRGIGNLVAWDRRRSRSLGGDMNPLLEELVNSAPLDAHHVRRFAEQHGWPLMDGDRVTFAYFGEADAVSLRHWIWGLEGNQPLTRIPGKPVWYLELELPKQSRVEYKLAVKRGDHEEWILDPFNRRRAHDPFGANSVCHGPGYERPRWTFEDPRARKGSLDVIHVDSRAFGDTRE